MLKTTLFAVSIAALRLFYLAWWSPFELIGDEAHYWEWSRHLDLSYYSKGPGIAWLIKAGTTVFGATELGVRCCAVICSLITSLALAKLTIEVGGTACAAFTSVLLFQLIPVFQGTSMLMTIDSPLLACWTIALWMTARWVGNCHQFGTAFGLGAVLGLGFLFKYTMLLLVVPIAAVVATIWQGVGRRGPCRPATIALATGVAGLAMAPVLVWNARQGWPTLRHLLGHLGLRGGDLPASETSWNPLWILEYVGGQIGIVGPFALLLMAMAITAATRSLEPLVGDRAHRLLLLASSLVPILFYFGVALMTDVEANWPITAYPSAIVLAALWLQVTAAASSDATHGVEAWTGRLWQGVVAWGLAAAVLLHCLPLFATLPGIGGLVPMHRLTGHRQLATEVETLLAREEQQFGRRPMIITDHYMLASLLAFYLPGNPEVQCGSRWIGGRKTQYDYFSETAIRNPTEVQRPILLIGGDRRTWSPFLGDDDPSVITTVGSGRAQRQVFLSRRP